MLSCQEGAGLSRTERFRRGATAIATLALLAALAIPGTLVLFASEAAGSVATSTIPGDFVLNAESFATSGATNADFVSTSASITLDNASGVGDPATGAHYYTDYTPALTGAEYALDGDENFNVIFSTARTAFAFDYVDDSFDSVFTLNFFDGLTPVGSTAFTSTSPFAAAKFIGFISDTPFDRVEIREDDGTNNADEFFQFYSASPKFAQTSIPLTTPQADFEQPGFEAALAIDGSVAELNGWSIDFGGTSRTFTVETASDFDSTAGIRIRLYHRYGFDFRLGRFRLSYTTDARGTFGPASGTWTVLDSNAGTFSDALDTNTASAQGDGSWLVLAGGSSPADYLLDYPVLTTGITGFRLEAIVDPSLPANGPGRAGNGNFILNEFEVTDEAPEVSPPTPIPLAAPQADLEQSGFPAAAIIDGSLASNNGWSIDTGGTARTLTVETTTDFSSTKGITVKLYNRYVPFDYRLGRFRLSYTTDARGAFGPASGNWTVLESNIGAFTDTLSKGTAAAQGDGSWLVDPSDSNLADYELDYPVFVSGITGFRLETLLDPSLPVSGPGWAGNGNFQLTEMEITDETNFPIDSDSDGIFDDVDNCPYLPDPTNGCVPNSMTIEYDVTTIPQLGYETSLFPATGSFKIRYAADGLNTIVSGPTTLLSLSVGTLTSLGGYQQGYPLLRDFSLIGQAVSLAGVSAGFVEIPYLNATTYTLSGYKWGSQSGTLPGGRFSQLSAVVTATNGFFPEMGFGTDRKVAWHGKYTGVSGTQIPAQVDFLVRAPAGNTVISPSVTDWGTWLAGNTCPSGLGSLTQFCTANAFVAARSIVVGQEVNRTYVPEPGGSAMLGAGFLMLERLARRRRGRVRPDSL